MGCQNAERVSFHCQSATGDYTREGLKDCDEEFKTFLTTMETLGEKLGPLLFQFGKFDKYAFKSLEDFLARLVPFLKKLPKEHKFAVEIRNKDGLVLNSQMCCGSTASLSR